MSRPIEGFYNMYEKTFYVSYSQHPITGAKSCRIYESLQVDEYEPMFRCYTGETFWHAMRRMCEDKLAQRES